MYSLIEFFANPSDIQKQLNSIIERQNKLQSYKNNDLPADINDMNGRFKAYLRSAGTDAKQMEGDNAVIGIMNKINARLAEYKTLIGEAAQFMKKITDDQDISQKMGRITQLHNEIAQLKKELKELEISVDSSEDRYELIKNRDNTASYFQLFGIERPIKEYSIPVLISLAVLFFMVGFYILFMLMPSMPEMPTMASMSGSGDFSIKSILLSPYVLITIIVGLVIGWIVYSQQKKSNN
jgi:hypothetical protein